MAGMPPSCGSCASRPQARSAVRASTWIVGIACFWLVQSAAGFESGRAAFSVRVNDDLVIPYDVFAVYVVPGGTLDIEVEAAAGGSEYSLEAADGTVVDTGSGRWRWTAPPRAGLAGIDVAGDQDRVRLNVVVMHAADGLSQSRLNGYRIGNYPDPLNGDPAYRAPEGFIELNDGTADLQLSPHFRLSQFPSKQSVSLPKYLVLREQLLLKLELLLEHVNAHGFEADTFTIMSGFRTPYYNAAIGNVPHSRHVFGGAADIYVDVSPKDGIMDDLDGDGVHDHRDAQWLYARAEELFAASSHELLRGGMGVYGSTAAHGPFLHLDARGSRARWGLLPSPPVRTARNR